MARSPIMTRRRLGSELRRLREVAGLRLEDVAEKLDCSVSKISRLETGKGIPRLPDIQALIRAYGVLGTDEGDQLVSLARQGRGQNWWHEFSDELAPGGLVADRLDRYLELEAGAAEILSFELDAVHGLLQTADYARAVVRGVKGATDQHEIDRAVELRLRRQEILARAEHPVSLHTVIDESALHRHVGGRAVMRDQLRSLLGSAQRPNITLQVLPYTHGAHGSMFGSFVVLGFDAAEDHDLVYIETSRGSLYLEQPHDLEVHRKKFQGLVGDALTPAASQQLLESVLSEF